MSSWISAAIAGSLMLRSRYTPALISNCTSSARRPARSRHARAAASVRSTALADAGPSSAVAVATASMIVPMALDESPDAEDDDADLQSRGQRQQQHAVALAQTALVQVLPQRDEMRRRCGVAQLVDGDDEMPRERAAPLAELHHRLLDRPRGGLVGDQVVDLVELQSGLVEHLAQHRHGVFDPDP